jgi:hypothetical protein
MYRTLSAAHAFLLRNGRLHLVDALPHTRANWRTTPRVVDWNRDGLPDLVLPDHEGHLALYERRRAAGWN